MFSAACWLKRIPFSATILVGLGHKCQGKSTKLPTNELMVPLQSGAEKK